MSLFFFVPFVSFVLSVLSFLCFLFLFFLSLFVFYCFLCFFCFFLTLLLFRWFISCLSFVSFLSFFFRFFVSFSVFEQDQASGLLKHKHDWSLPPKMEVDPRDSGRYYDFHIPFVDFNRPLRKLIITHVFEEFLGLTLEDTVELRLMRRRMHNFMALATFLEWRMQMQQLEENQLKEQRARSEIVDSSRYWNSCCLLEDGCDCITDLSNCNSAVWFEDTRKVLKHYTSNGNHCPLERICDSYTLNGQVEDSFDREGSLLHNFVVWIRTNPKKHTYETYKTEMARLKEVVEHKKGTTSMFQDLIHKQKTPIPIWEGAFAYVAAADVARAGLEAARFTIQMIFSLPHQHRWIRIGHADLRGRAPHWKGSTGR